MMRVRKDFPVPVAPKIPDERWTKRVQVHADRVVLLPGGADLEVPCLAFLAEDFGHVARAGQADRGVVRRDGLDRQRAQRLVRVSGDPGRVVGRPGIGSALEHQRGQDLQVGVQGLPVQQAGELRGQAALALLVGKARVGSAQLQVGHQAVEHPVPALDDDKAAFLHALRRNGQPHAQVLFEPTADDITN